MGACVFMCAYVCMYMCICADVCLRIYVYVHMHICTCVYVFVCKNSKRRDEIFFCPSFLSSLFLPTVSLPVSVVSATVSVLCPPSLTLALHVCHSLGLSVFPLVPLSPSTQSLCWHRSTGYLGNHCRVITCDWPGWGLTLGWQADFWGASCPQFP